MRNRRGVATQVHEYEGQFKGKPAKFKVTAVMGHVYSLDFPKEYNNWGAVEPVELFDAPTVKMESNPKVQRGILLCSGFMLNLGSNTSSGIFK